MDRADGRVLGTAISIPLRTAVPPSRSVASPEPAGEPSAGGPPSMPRKGSRGTTTASRGRPVLAAENCCCSLSHATCSSPAHCAVRSRRESMRAMCAEIGNGPVRGSARVRAFRFAGAKLRRRLFQGRALRRQLLERPAIRSAIRRSLIDASAATAPGRAREVAQVVGAKDRTRVAAAPALVDVHQLRPQSGSCAVLWSSSGEALALPGRPPPARRRLPPPPHPFLDAQVALDLQLAHRRRASSPLWRAVRSRAGARAGDRRSAGSADRGGLRGSSTSRRRRPRGKKPFHVLWVRQLYGRGAHCWSRRGGGALASR